MYRSKKKDNGMKEEGNEYNNPMKRLYKGIQNEIKNIVITKMHNQISNLMKEIQKLKKENAIIKNDLIYILKRILNNKNEYNLINQKMHYIGSNSCINLNSNINNSMIYSNNSTINLNKSKNSFISIDKTINVNRNTSRTKISLMRSPEKIENFLNSEQNTKYGHNTYHLDRNKYKNVDHKIDSYLNSLYRHNFIESHIGSESTYNLNKNKGIYDELFTQNSLYDNYKSNNSQKSLRKVGDEKVEKGKSSSVKGLNGSGMGEAKKSKNLSVKMHKNHSRKYNYYLKRMNYYKMNLSKKGEDGLNNSLSDDKKNKTNRGVKADNSINKNRNVNSSIGDIHNNGNKSNTRLNIISSRSPFLVNKF